MNARFSADVKAFKGNLRAVGALEGPEEEGFTRTRVACLGEKIDEKNLATGL